MPLLPDIKTLIKSESHHLLKRDEDIWILMDKPFEEKLKGLLQKFQTARIKEKPDLLQPSDYPHLPNGKHKIDILEWKFRQGSLEIVNRLLSQRKNQLILEVGPWNGWLTNRLAEKGHTVVAIDYFIDERDGLKTKKYYKNDWIALQADISKPDFFSVKFDTIILNHGLQFFANPIDYVESLKPILKKDGILIILGLSFYKNPLKKRKEVQEYSQSNLAKYGFDFFNPTKGYLDFADKRALEQNRFIFKPYSKCSYGNSILWSTLLSLPIHLEYLCTNERLKCY